MPTPAARRWCFAIFAALFVAWIGYLLYLVLETARPTVQFWPPRITKTQPIILSRPQFLVSKLDVIAEVREKDGRPEPEATVIAVHWPPEKQNQLIDKTIKVANLWEEDRGRSCEGWNGPGRYILALVENGPDYQVARIQPSPGFDTALPRIYPATPETEAQLGTIRKPEAAR